MENYESLGVIGEGTYGVVIKARHRETGQVVAIKKFKESDEDEQVRKTSLREVRVLKQLRHENIITLLEVFRRKGKLYLVFEYVEKTILEVLEKRPNGLEEIDVKRFMYQLLRGVEYCHAHNVIHRDIKPENILISRNGAVKLCDFGFARTMSIGGKYTDYVATRWYRGPELLVGDVEYGKGVDVWAIGCIFAEISNGMPLFPGESDVDQLSLIMRCFGKLTPRHVQIFRRNPLYVGVDLPAPREIDTLDQRFPAVPRNWLAFLKACLKNDPDQRETCTGLMNMPYFTESNFRHDFEAELRLVLDKETKQMSAMRSKPSTCPTPPDQQTTSLPTTITTKSQAPKKESNYGSLWSQYLANNSPGTTTEFPDLGTKVQMMQQNSMQHHTGTVYSTHKTQPPKSQASTMPSPAPSQENQSSMSMKSKSIFPMLNQNQQQQQQQAPHPTSNLGLYKKKPAKRQMLSTLSLTSFGQGQQQQPYGNTTFGHPSNYSGQAQAEPTGQNHERRGSQGKW